MYPVWTRSKCAGLRKALRRALLEEQLAMALPAGGEKPRARGRAVDEAATNLLRRGHRAREVPVEEHLPRAPNPTVDAAGDATGEALHAPREGRLVLGLDDEVQVIALHGVVHEPERLTRGRGERAAEHRVELAIAQPRHVLQHAQDDVHRMMALVIAPQLVALAARDHGLAAGTLALAAAPAVRQQRELLHGLIEH